MAKIALTVNLDDAEIMDNIASQEIKGKVRQMVDFEIMKRIQERTPEYLANYLESMEKNIKKQVEERVDMIFKTTLIEALTNAFVKNGGQQNGKQNEN